MATWKNLPVNALFLFALFPHFVFAEALSFESVLDESKIEFVSHTKTFDVEGEFKRWKVQVSLTKPDPLAAKITVQVDTSSVKTGIARRDLHLKGPDFFWHGKFPMATFESKNVEKGKGKNQFLVDGFLKLRDQEKKIKVPMKMEELLKDGIKKYRLTGGFTVNRRDFGIVYQSEWFFIPDILDPVDIKLDVLLQQIP